MTRLWLVRLGKFGELEPRALESGELVTGWTVSSLLDAKNKDSVLASIQQSSPEEKLGTLQNWAAQLNQLRNTMKAGDITITPLKTTGQLAIGRVYGDYEEIDGHPTRRVKWLRTDLPRNAVKQDLLYSFGASQTVCEVSRNDAVRRVELAATKGLDPGPSIAMSGVASSAEPAVLEAEQSVQNLADLARDQIEARISAHFAGHAFTELIAAILRAQGYQTRVSPPGADKGVDIVAGQGALGFDGPRLVVQVKSGDIVTDQPTLQGLIGCIADTRAEHGLLVSWSGFKSSVRQRTNELYFRVRLWDRREILDALLSVYDQLPEEMRAELPLRRIWTLVPDEDQ